MHPLGSWQAAKTDTGTTNRGPYASAFAILQIPTAEDGDPAETGLKVECFVCPASTPLQMPQYLKIYAPGAGIRKHKNIFVFTEKKNKYFYHHC